MVSVLWGAFFARFLAFWEDQWGQETEWLGQAMGQPAMASAVHLWLGTASWHLKECALYEEVMSEWKLKQRD